LLLRHVGEQQLEHHLLRGERARRVGGDLHAGARVAAARGRERALALDLHNAGAAVAVGALVAAVAQVRDHDAVLLRGLDDLLVGPADDGLAVELELDRHHRELLVLDAFHQVTFRSLPGRNTSSRSAPGWAPPAPGRRSRRPSWPEKAPSAKAGPTCP